MNLNPSEPQSDENEPSHFHSNGAHTSSPADTGRHDEAHVLRQELEGKNELIAALVAELEQVAEQLDRVKRSGTDRPRSNGAGGVLPTEVIEEHQQVLGDLQRVIEQLDELQTGSALHRIEGQLAELRSMVASGVRPLEPGSNGLSPSDPRDLDSVMSRLANDSTPESESDSGSQSSQWESMKRQMLGEPAPQEAEDRQEPEDHGDNELITLLDGLPVPTPLEGELSIETLKQACADRDTYIVQVTRWIRTHRAVSIPNNWDEIAGVPEELRRNIDRLELRLEEQVRLAEVEMSLERARLSREKSQLQSERANLERHLKRLGINSPDEFDDFAVNSGTSSDRRWMRFLGVNRKS